MGPPPGGGSVYPQSINAAGDVAGYIVTTSNAVTFRWTAAAGFQLYPKLPGADAPAAAQGFALNDAGQIVGSGSWIFGGSRGFVADINGTPALLPTLGGEIGVAFGVNNTGQIVGEAETTNGAQHAVLFDGTSTVDLVSPGGDSMAFFINDVGDIAGSAVLASGVEHACVWGIGSALQDLNPLIAPTLGWVLNEAHAINEGGLVVGDGTVAGQSRAFLLTPRSGPDNLPPAVTASLNLNLLTNSFTSLMLTLKVWDDIAVEGGTVIGAVRVTGPNGFSALATYTGRTPFTNSIAHTVTYQVNAPGGYWDGADSGAYTVSLEPNSLRDIAGNFTPPQGLANFTVAIDTAPRLNAGVLPAEGLVNETNMFSFGASSSYPATNWFTWTVDWDGDGTVDETLTGPGPRTFAHAYDTPGARAAGRTEPGQIHRLKEQARSAGGSAPVGHRGTWVDLGALRSGAAGASSRSRGRHRPSLVSASCPGVCRTRSRLTPVTPHV